MKRKEGEPRKSREWGGTHEKEQSAESHKQNSRIPGEVAQTEPTHSTPVLLLFAGLLLMDFFCRKSSATLK